MSHLDTKAVMMAFGTMGINANATADMAAKLLGVARGWWLHHELWDSLVLEQQLDGAEEIIAAIIEWETSNPTKLSDPGLMAVAPRDPRLGHVPAAQRKLFADRWADRCPQCGAQINETK